MNCPDCELHWQRLLDGDDAPATPGLIFHLAGCPDCRKRQAATLLLVHGLRKVPRPLPSPGLNQRILTAVLADRRERLTWRRRLALIATAAAFLLAPFLGTYWLGQTGPTSALPALVKQAVPQAPVVMIQPEPKTPRLRPQLDESQLGLKRLVERLSLSTLQPQQVLETVALPMQLASLETLTGLESLDQATAGIRNANQGFALGTQTITSTTRRALSYFSGNLPPLSAPPKPPL